MDKIKLAQRTIALLSSMIEGGESHTSRTIEMKKNALEGLDEVNKLLLQRVSQQRELLFAYVTRDLKKPISDFNSEGFYKTIDNFLANNCG